MVHRIRKDKIMKKTNERIFKQHSALVDVIQWLDANGHSNEPIRETVDRVLNGSTWNRLEEDSNREIELVQVKKRAGIA
mgnify:CR=1 FL=1|jgi:hypothetical protein